MIPTSRLKNDADLQKALARLTKLGDSEKGSQEFQELELLSILVESYEREHHRVVQGDPLKVILYKMGELSLSVEDLAKKSGFTLRKMMNILDGTKVLTAMDIRKLAKALRIRAGLLKG